MVWAVTGHINEETYSGTLKYYSEFPAGVGFNDINQMKVDLAGNTDSFYSQCSVQSACVNVNGGPATLTHPQLGMWVYTSGDGAIYTFSEIATPATSTTTPIQIIGKLQQIARPNGTVINIYYDGSNNIRAVSSNAGYALRYQQNSGSTTIYGVNTTAHNCDLTVTTCDGFDNYVNVADFAYGAPTVTDALGNTTKFSIVSVDYDPVNDIESQDTLESYTSPLNNQVNVIYASWGRVTSYTDYRGTWIYSYSDNSTDQIRNIESHTVTTKDPSGAVVSVAIVNKKYGIMTSIKDGLSRTTHYGNASYPVINYSGQYFLRPTSTTPPEGDYINNTGTTTDAYDTRGNITSVTRTPKTGSGLSATVIYASYPSTCSNMKTCNQPTWTKDAKGNQTDYTYDGTHGGVLTVTLPADQNALRQRTYNTYTPYDTGNGLIYRLTRTETCGLNAGQLALTACPATSTTAVTTTTYVGKTFLPLAVTQTDGAGSVSATTTYTYDNIGNAVIVDGPRTDVDDKSYKTYDANRRVIFDIGVDPDGSGALRRVAVRHTYDGDGREWKTETGSCGTVTLVNGLPTTCADFAVSAFTRVTFDAAGRAIKTEAVQP